MAARQPRGVPTGGQFAAQTHAEADISLVDVQVLDRPGLDGPGGAPEMSAAVRRILADYPGEAAHGDTVELEGTYYNPTLPVTVGVRDADAVRAFKSDQSDVDDYLWTARPTPRSFPTSSKQRNVATRNAAVRNTNRTRRFVGKFARFLGRTFDNYLSS